MSIFKKHICIVAVIKAIIKALGQGYETDMEQPY